MDPRLAKLERIRARSQDPYPPRYHRTHSSTQAVEYFRDLEAARKSAPDLPSSTLSLAGRLVSNRAMGKATFAHLQDGWGRLQLYLRIDRLGEEKYRYYEDFDLGDFIGATGKLFRTRTGEVTLEVEDFAMLAKSLHPLPEKWHGLVDVEKRYRQRYLDLIANQEVQNIFLVRSRLISSIRRFLDRRDFLEVETPALQPIYGGAFARPFVTHHHSLDQRMYLRIATELYLKRLVIGGLERVYEIGKNFRNEGLSTKHNPEFTALEAYQAYADYNDMMAMTEEMLSTAAQEVLGATRVAFQGQEIDLTPPWRRLTVGEALQEHACLDLGAYRDPHSLAEALRQKGLHAEASTGWGKLVDLAISTWVEPRLIQPTFMTDFPLELSPLAKQKPENPNLVERFEPFIAGMELGNAFTELNDPQEQRYRFQQQALAQEAGDEEAQPMDLDFLTALEHGMPPTGGLGLGIDRLVMLFTNNTSIREVILFPQLRGTEPDRA